MSPLQESSLIKSDDSIDEFDKDIKLDKIEKEITQNKYPSEPLMASNSFINLSAIAPKIKTPDESFQPLKWNPEQLYYMKDCKTDIAKENFWQCVDHLTIDMKNFTSNLMTSLKDVCLTKISEKSVNLMMKKYTLRLETLKDQWQCQDQANQSQNEDFSLNLKNMLHILGNW